MERPGIVFGVVAILAGLGVGWLMLAFPEGRSSAYPIWIALLVPLAFVVGGVACRHARRASRSETRSTSTVPFRCAA